MGSDGDSACSVHSVYEVLDQCEISRAFDKAPHLLIAGAFTVSMFDKKLQVVLSFSEDAVALYAMDFFSKFSLLATAF